MRRELEKILTGALVAPREGGVRLIQPIKNPPRISVTIDAWDYDGIPSTSRSCAELTISGELRQLVKLEAKLRTSQRLRSASLRNSDNEFASVANSVEVIGASGSRVECLEDAELGAIRYEANAYSSDALWLGRSIWVSIDSENWILACLARLKKFLSQQNVHEKNARHALTNAILHSQELDYGMPQSNSSKRRLCKSLELQMLYLSGNQSNEWVTLYYAPLEKCAFDFFQVIYDEKNYSVYVDLD